MSIVAYTGLPTGSFDHVEIVHSPMKVLEDGLPFHGTRVKSLRLSHNELSVIRGTPFRSGTQLGSNLCLLIESAYMQADAPPFAAAWINHV
jgi:hypothetical protein